MITDKMRKSLNILNERFHYVSDEQEHGTNEYWTTMPIEDVMRGDCEDYSLTLLKIIKDNSTFKMMFEVLFGDADLWYVKVPQADGSEAGHCVLEYDGHFVDNNFRNYVAKSTMEKRARYRFRYKYDVLQLTAKYAQHLFIKLFKL